MSEKQSKPPSNPRNRRKNKVVDFFLQLRIAAEVLILSMALFVLLIFVAYVPPFAMMFSSHPLEIHQTALSWLIEINMNKWPLVFLLICGWVLLTIFFSHRLIGPFHKFTLMFRKYAKRDFSHRTYLRENDFFKPLVPLINQTVDNANNDIAALRENIAKVHEVLIQVRDEEAKQKAMSALRSMENLLNRYRIDGDPDRLEETEEVHDQAVNPSSASEAEVMQKA